MTDFSRIHSTFVITFSLTTSHKPYVC